MGLMDGVFVDGWTGPFQTLYQTWEQQKGAALRLAEARVAEDRQRISQLESSLPRLNRLRGQGLQRGRHC